MNYSRRHKGVAVITLLVIIAICSLVLFSSITLAITVMAGLSTGALSIWLTRPLRNYNSYFIDLRDSD